MTATTGTSSPASPGSSPTKGRRESRRALPPKPWTVREVVIALVLTALVVLVAVPVLYALLNSFRTYAEITRDPMGIPTTFNLDNYVDLFQRTDFAEARSDEYTSELQSRSH